VLRAEGKQGRGEARPLADSQGPTPTVRAWQARGTLAEIILTSKSMISLTYLFPSSNREAIHGGPTPTVLGHPRAKEFPLFNQSLKQTKNLAVREKCK